jgi:hypothetical protein
MKKLLTILLLSIALHAGNSSWLITAKQFLKQDRNYQSIYIIGALDSHLDTLANAYGEKNEISRCITRYKPAAIVRIVKRYIANNPKKRRYSAAKVITYAVDQHCRKQ